MNVYFSDKERGARPRHVEVVPKKAWGGIVATIDSLVRTGALGIDFPETCPDGAGPVGTSVSALSQAMLAEIPELEWPLDSASPPDTFAILDLLEFCHRHVARPTEEGYHSFFKHTHLSYERAAGQSDFRDRANRILSRNGLAFELSDEGSVSRLSPPVLREVLATDLPTTGDTALDEMLTDARAKFLSHDPATRRDAVEKLWDAWERAKTIQNPSDKKKSTGALLDSVTTEPDFRAMLETEAKELTRIGNTFRIRHNEVGQTPISSPRTDLVAAPPTLDEVRARLATQSAYGTSDEVGPKRTSSGPSSFSS